jgi:hypothetical protein
MSCISTNADFRPAQYNISIWKSNTWSQIFLLTANTVPINLSAATVEIEIRKTINSSNVELTLTELAGGGITVGGVNNNMITINKDINLAAGNYVYDMAVKFSNTNVKTYIWGNFIVYQDITQI